MSKYLCIYVAIYLFFQLATATDNVPHIKFNLPHFLDTDDSFSNIFKHGEDNKISVNLDALKQVLATAPGTLRSAIHSNDVALVKRITKELRKASELSVPCMYDLVVYLQNLREFIETSRDLQKYCFDGEKTNCSCLGILGPRVQEGLWVLKVLDSQGKMPSGIIKGNILWYGSYKTCVETSAVKNVQGQLWEAKYCTANIYSSWNPFDMHENNSATIALEDQSHCFEDIPMLQYGFCLPETCTEHDARKIVEIFLSPIKVACKVTTKCHERDKKFREDTASQIMLAFLVFIVVIMIFGSLYDYFVYQELLRSVPDYDPALEMVHYNNQPSFVKIILSFSVYSNTKKIFSVTKRPGTIDCLHGLRFFSMLWIILGHTYYYCCASITMDNLLDAVINFPYYFLDQFILNAVLAVDTFFFLSGLLLSYLWFKHTHKVRGRNIKSGGFWSNFYIHRYLRLTPVYMIILGLHVTLLDYLAEGPFWRPIEKDRCRDSWWANMAYLNNFFHVKTDACMGWTWYMANDMQLYFLSPVILILFWHYEILGYIISGGLILMSGIVHCAIVMANDWPPAPILTADLHVLNVLNDYWPSTYVKPYIRCGPWIMGMIVGYVLYRHHRTLRMPKWLVWTGWIVCLGLAFAVIFGTYPYSKTGHMGWFGRAMYALFGRIIWAMCLGWLVLACATGHGGPVDGFLSWNRWIPFSRLTYCAYLIHPIILSSYFLSRQTPMHFSSDWQMLGYFGSMTVLSYGIAYFASCAFEIPVSHLETITKARHAAAELERKEPPVAHKIRSATGTRIRDIDGYVPPVIEVTPEERSLMEDGAAPPESGML